MKHCRGVHVPRGDQGAALMIVVISALVFSVMAYGVLAVSFNKTQLVIGDEQRMRARFAAEAALVYAYQRLWRADAEGNDFPNTASCGAPNPCTPLPECDPGGGVTTGVATVPIDPDADTGTNNDIIVTLTVENCGVGNDRKVSAKVSY